jgi:hypothetical protein
MRVSLRYELISSAERNKRVKERETSKRHVGVAQSVLTKAILLPQRLGWYCGKIVHCACSPILGPPICVWPLHNRDPPARICSPTYVQLLSNCLQMAMRPMYLLPNVPALLFEMVTRSESQPNFTPLSNVTCLVLNTWTTLLLEEWFSHCYWVLTGYGTNNGTWWVPELFQFSKGCDVSVSCFTFTPTDFLMACGRAIVVEIYLFYIR